MKRFRNGEICRMENHEERGKSMRKSEISYRICSYAFLLLLLTFTGCAKEQDSLTDEQTVEMQTSAEKTEMEEITTEEKTAEPIITEVDWSDFFNGMNGAAVVYDADENGYQIYHQELALTQRSPCSTFKIISSLIALENEIIRPDDSTRTWSGEIFWNEEWNQDIDFSQAFRTSCVWYFREVIDEIGKDLMQEELDKLQYGNCDISDWEGRLNTNNSNPALTGFWIESSLLISPREQVEVMERIFGDTSEYSEETINQLKQVMLVPEENEAGISIYGKTGMGKANGVVIDSWFTGFAEAKDKRIYFCVYLGETEDQNVSSAKAKEIAIQIVSDYLGSENEADTQNLTYEEMMDQFYEKFYAGLSQEEIEERITEGISYYQASKYYGEVTNYWENIRGVTDISNVIEPLYFTDMKYYREEDFQNDPKIIIHLAKNEIYARHGYIFKDEDLYSYFMGCAWYRPAVAGEEFDDAVFNDYERKNLELLAAMDREPEQ